MNRTVSTLHSKKPMDAWIREGLACVCAGRVSFIVQDGCLLQINSVEVIQCACNRQGGVKMAQHDEKPEVTVTDPEIQRLLAVISSVQYGSVTAIIQDSKIVQIEKNVKLRLK